MSAKFKQLSEEINQRANDWFVHMHSGNATDAEREQLNTWLSESPEHREAYQQLHVIWQDLGDLAETAEGHALKQSMQPASIFELPKRAFDALTGFLQNAMVPVKAYHISSIVAVSIAIVMVIFGVEDSGKPVVNHLHTSTTGEIKSIEMADGSRIVLGAQSEIQIQINEDRRLVDLISGEAFFDVRTDAEKPFFVNVNDVSVRVVGTQFDVHKRYSSISIAVLEGSVSVAERSTYENKTHSPGVVLTAGQQVIKPKNMDFEAVKTISDIELGAWRSGRLIYRDMALIDIITDASRYFDGVISLRASELADQKVTVTLRADQVTELPEMLSQTLPLAVREMPENRFLLERRINSH